MPYRGAPGPKRRAMGGQKLAVLQQNELAEHRQRQEAHEQAEQNRIAMTEEFFIEPLHQTASQDPFDN